jgi:PIN domain nuclease of toxin-antitoxin system
MKLLLDTHVVIWWIEGSVQISDTARDAITDPDASLFVSAVAAWEYMQKLLLRPGRLSVKLPFEMMVRRLRLQTLPFEYRQHTHAFTLPDIHRDPFDRMMIAQALDQELTIVTRDRHIRRYPVPTLW